MSNGTAQSFAQTLWQAQHAVEQLLDAALAPLGMTTTLAGTLESLALDPGQSTADLARKARVAPQSAAKAVVRLGQLGMVRRAAHPVHGRIVQLYLTESGTRALAEANTAIAAVESELCAVLDERTPDYLRDHLLRLRERAEQLRDGYHVG